MDFERHFLLQVLDWPGAPIRSRGSGIFGPRVFGVMRLHSSETARKNPLSNGHVLPDIHRANGVRLVIRNPRQGISQE